MKQAKTTASKARKTVQKTKKTTKKSKMPLRSSRHHMSLLGLAVLGVAGLSAVAVATLGSSDDVAAKAARPPATPPAVHALNVADPGAPAAFLLSRRYLAGGVPNARLKARLNAASDS